ncbi:MAG: hypothetical protein JWO13_2305 [Acidobacteriales bacterium]|nr:hypothetical protein [Terriglobales bacterium]
MSTLAGMLRKGRFVGPVLLAVALASASANTSDETPPETLRLDNQNFKVQMEPFTDSYAGMTRFDKKVIQIDPSSISGLRRKVYLHELIHVAWHEGKPSTNKEQKFTEEEAIQQLVPGLLKVLEQNPQAVEYLSRANAGAVAQIQLKK